jgi:hypothetical protein
MPLPNGTMGVANNPLLESPFIQEFIFGGISPPPPGSFIISEIGQFVITETGDNMITE